jgi:hypothetical protein
MAKDARRLGNLSPRGCRTRTVTGLISLVSAVALAGLAPGAGRTWLLGFLPLAFVGLLGILQASADT